MRKLLLVVLAGIGLQVSAGETTVEGLTGKIALALSQHGEVSVKTDTGGTNPEIWVNSNLAEVPHHDKAGKLRGTDKKIVPGKTGVVVRIYGPYGPDPGQKMWTDFDRKGRFERVFNAGNGKFIGVVVTHGPDAPKALLKQLKDMKKVANKKPKETDESVP